MDVIHQTSRILPDMFNFGWGIPLWMPSCCAAVSAREKKKVHVSRQRFANRRPPPAPRMACNMHASIHHDYLLVRSGEFMCSVENFV